MQDDIVEQKFNKLAKLYHYFDFSKFSLGCGCPEANKLDNDNGWYFFPVARMGLKIGFPLKKVKNT